MCRLHVITHIAKANGAGLILQFAVTIGGACEAIERMVGDIKLHDAFPQFRQMRGLGVYDHAGFDRRRTTGRGAFAAINFNKAQTAGAIAFHAVSGA